MRELLFGLGMLSCPVAVFVVFGNTGSGSFSGSFGGKTGTSYSTVAPEPAAVALAEECAGCHGRQAQGTDRGPNLIHPDFGRAKRSDAQFRQSVREGVEARQGYGAMPAAPNISERSLNRMIVLLRELQRANGIR